MKYYKKGQFVVLRYKNELTIGKLFDKSTKDNNWIVLIDNELFEIDVKFFVTMSFDLNYASGIKFDEHGIQKSCIYKINHKKLLNRRAVNIKEVL